MMSIHPIQNARVCNQVTDHLPIKHHAVSPESGFASGTAAPVSVANLRRNYRGRWGRKVEALKGVSLEAPAGQVTGLLGPNGAGKTTTLRIILGMLRPSSGEVRLFGGSVNDPASRRRLGFLTEQPYFYDYLTARELLDLCGVLCDVGPADRRRRSAYWLERMGLSHAADLRLRKFSKGMLQRLGLAQALIHEPELVILDEPMSGLDPLGRSLVRDVILELKQRGATVLFSSHVLPDVETLCDRVTVVAGGSVVLDGAVVDLVADTDAEFEIVVSRSSPEFRQTLTTRGIDVTVSGSRLLISAPDRAAMNRLVAELIRDGAEIAAVAPRRSPLEQRFLAAVRQAGVTGGMHDGGRDMSDASTAARMAAALANADISTGNNTGNPTSAMTGANAIITTITTTGTTTDHPTDHPTDDHTDDTTDDHTDDPITRTGTDQ